MDKPTRKTIEVRLQLTSGQSNFSICEAIEQLLVNSPLNNSEFKLEVQEVKVTHEESTDAEQGG